MKVLHVRPRRSGKTTELIDRYDELEVKGVPAIIVAHSEPYARNLRASTPGRHIHSVAGLNPSSIPTPLFAKTVLLVDEYFLLTHEDIRTLNEIATLTRCDIEAWGTADRLYDRQLVESMRLYRQAQMDFEDDYKDILDCYWRNRIAHVAGKTEIQFLMDHLLTDPDCKVDTGNVFMALSEEQRMCQGLGEVFRSEKQTGSAVTMDSLNNILMGPLFKAFHPIV